MAKRPSSRPLTSEDRELWRRVSRGFKPLSPDRQDNIAPLKAALDGTTPIAPLKADRQKPAPAPKLRAPINRSDDRHLRRGRFEVDAKLDLHGLTSAKARQELLGFLIHAQNRGHMQVLVITGKGATARAVDRRRFEAWDPEAPHLPGVIRRSFTQWMREPEFAPLVAGYAEAHRRHGGSGAFYVMVRV